MPKPWTLEELKEQLVEYQKTKPRILEEDEFRQMLDHSTIHNFSIWREFLGDARKALEKLVAGNTPTDQEVTDAVAALDDAEYAFQKGVLTWNKQGGSQGQLQRSILWFDSNS